MLRLRDRVGEAFLLAALWQQRRRAKHTGVRGWPEERQRLLLSSLESVYSRLQLLLSSALQVASRSTDHHIVEESECKNQHGVDSKDGQAEISPDCAVELDFPENPSTGTDRGPRLGGLQGYGFCAGALREYLCRRVRFIQCVSRGPYTGARPSCSSCLPSPSLTAWSLESFLPARLHRLYVANRLYIANRLYYVVKHLLTQKSLEFDWRSPVSEVLHSVEKWLYMRLRSLFRKLLRGPALSDPLGSAATPET